MRNNLKRTQELQRKYEYLLDKYVDNAHAEYSIKQEREEEARNRYGHLLDYAKPGYKIYRDIIGVDDVCRGMIINRQISGGRNALRMRGGNSRSVLIGIMLL